MERISLVIILLLTFGYVKSQGLYKEDIYGKWIVKDAALSDLSGADFPEEGKLGLEQMRQGLISTMFIFHADGNFNIEFPDDIPPFVQEMEFLDNKYWKISDDRSMLLVGTPEDNYNLMGIIVAVQSGKTFFILDESPFLLEVIKN